MTRTPCQAQPDLFFSTSADDRREAAEACSHCPLLQPCREIALPRELARTRFNRWGIWAGVDVEATNPMQTAAVQGAA